MSIITKIIHDEMPPRKDLSNTQLSQACSIGESDFSELFDLFFETRSIDISSKVDFSSGENYQNCQIIKIEIKPWRTYDDFLESALWKIVEYYEDGASNPSRRNWVLKQLNQYMPVSGITLSELHSSVWIKVNWRDETSHTLLAKVENGTLGKRPKFENIPFTEIQPDNLDRDDKYLLSNWTIKSAREILGHLHGDVGEFLLYFISEWLLRTPSLFSKIKHCKSSPWDKVKWSDGIHLASIDWEYSYNFLEAKVTKDFSSSITQVLKSNVEFLSNDGEWDIDNEITIIYNNLNTVQNRYWFLYQNGFEYAIEPYLDCPENQEKLWFCLTCLIAYACNSYRDASVSLDWDNYVDSISVTRIQKILGEYKKIEHLLWWRWITIIMFPIIDEVELLKKFLSRIKPL